MGYDNQTIDSKLKSASQFFQGLEDRWASKSRQTLLKEAVYGIKDKSGNSLNQYEAFQTLFAVMNELDGYSSSRLEELSQHGLPCVGTVARLPVMMPYERRLAGHLYGQMDLSSYTLGDLKNVDFIRFALLIEAYRQIYSFENRFS